MKRLYYRSFVCIHCDVVDVILTKHIKLLGFYVCGCGCIVCCQYIGTLVKSSSKFHPN